MVSFSLTFVISHLLNIMILLFLTCHFILPNFQDITLPNLPSIISPNHHYLAVPNLLLHLTYIHQLCICCIDFYKPCFIILILSNSINFILALLPLVMERLEKNCWFRTNTWLHAPFQTFACGGL